MISRSCLSLIVFLCCLVAAGCTQKTAVTPDPLLVTFLPQYGDFLNPHGEPLSLEELVEAMQKADYILLGEGHKNALDHKVQQQVAAQLATQERPFAVGLEMVAVDKQSILDDFAHGLVPLEQLEEELDWKKRWGYPFSLFHGLFALVQQHSLPVGALNLPPGVVRAVGRNGLESLDEDLRDYLPGRLVLPAEDQKASLKAVMQMHKGRDVTDTDQWKRFITAQSLWDSKMAEEAVSLRTRFNWPVLIIAGYGHVENGWGIARRIRLLEPGAKLFSLIPWRGETFDGQRADAFFYSPDSYTSRMGAVFTALPRGIVVESVQRNSRAARCGLRPGDILLQANGIMLEGLHDIHRAGIKAHESNTPLVFLVQREGKSFSLSMGLLQTKRVNEQPPALSGKSTPAARNPAPGQASSS